MVRQRLPGKINRDRKVSFRTTQALYDQIYDISITLDILVSEIIENALVDYIKKKKRERA